MKITVKNISVNYTDSGNGAPVLFLHGWGSSLQVYNAVINALRDRFRLIALDFPGCGETEVMSSAWTLTDYEDFVLEFLDKLNIKNPILVGHSHGGRVAMSLTAGKRLAPPKIILLDAAGLIPKKTIKQRLRSRSFKIIKSALTLPVIKNFSAGMLEAARRHYGSADYNAAPPVLRKTLVNLVNTDLRNTLHNINCPTLLIWGENDTATPLSDAKIIESLIPDAGLCVIKGTGHFSFAERPYEAIAIINSFLS